MTTSQTFFLTEILDDKQSIPSGKLAYFQERQRNRIYDFIVSRFLEKEKTNQLTRADLARRINKKPEQITRWLASPSNWTLDTISDLTLAISGGEMNFSINPLIENARNYVQADRLQEYTFTTGLKPTTSSSVGKNIFIAFNYPKNEAINVRR